MKPLCVALTLIAAQILPSLAAPIISEFMAANNASLADAHGQFPDWIEIHNPGSEAVDLKDHVLADADGEWVFPESAMVPPDGYLIVFASGDSVRDADGHWHTDFQLSRNGESLQLRTPTGEVLSAFDDVPSQRTDVSYGIASNDSVGYFKKPTPGKANNVVTLGFVGDTKFNINRGFYDEPIEVVISTDVEDATILYTTDGTAPDQGTIFTGPVGETYTDPIRIDTTAVLKAVAFKKGWESSNIDTQTYLFLDSILKQPADPPEGYPDEWGGNPADYEMDPEIVDHPDYRDDFEAAFTAFPTLSLGIALEDMFDRREGIYQNTQQEGHEWERPVSAEFIFPNDVDESFGVNAGIRIQGGSSRNTDIPKHSFSLRFRQQYGLGELRYPFFKDQPSGHTATNRFDYLQLRSGFNFAWTHRHYYQSRHAQYNRDQFVNDLHLAMGNHSPHGRWFHLYINGLYWGMYHMHERPDANFMAAYFGGAKDDYDAVNSGQATDGNLSSWNAMWSAARKAVETEDMALLEEHLDVDGFIDYMLLNYYVGNWDWDGHNWRAAGPKEVGTARWHFFPWDSEFAISPNGAGVINNPAPIENTLTINRTRAGGGANRPTGLQAVLIKSSLYKRRFHDRVQKHCFHGGPLSPEGSAKIWKARSDLMDIAIVAESARWGDYKRDLFPGRWPAANYDLYTKNDHYLVNQQFLFDRYFPERTAIVLEQMEDARYITRDRAPEFEVGGAPQHGGVVAPDDIITVSGGGTIVYTLDGSEPADEGALTYDRNAGIKLAGSATIKARAKSIFGSVSPLAEAFFAVGVPASSENLRITEVHYRPSSPSDEERAAGHLLRSDFEFLEIANLGSETVNAVGLQFSDGIRFEFASDVFIAPNHTILLVGNREAFRSRHPRQSDQIAGEFEGRLSDSGETLTLITRDGETVTSFAYNDREPWPELADGDGYSLVLANTGLTVDPQLAASWAASSASGGSPGSLDQSNEPTEPAPTYEAWRATVFTEDQLTNDAISSMHADFDRDGLSTVAEYVFATSPTEANAGGLTVGRASDGAIEIQLTKRRGLPQNVLQIDLSTDLKQWDPAGTTLTFISSADLDAETIRESYRSSASATGYLRLRITLPGG